MGWQWGQYPQLNDLARPYSPKTLNLDHLVSFYCLFYVKAYRVKLSIDVYKGAFSSIEGNLIMKIFWEQAPRLLICLSGTIADIDSIIASLEGVEIKHFLSESQALPCPCVSNKHSLFI